MQLGERARGRSRFALVLTLVAASWSWSATAEAGAPRGAAPGSSFTLPFAPDPKKVEAKVTNGVLTVTVAKPPEAKSTAKKIPVKAAG